MDCCMKPSESSCLLPSFLSEVVKVLLHLQSNSMGSSPFLAWSRISYRQSFTSVRSMQRFNKIGISCSFYPTPRDVWDVYFFLLEMDRSKKDNCKTWACLKGSICFSRSFVFSRPGKSLWWKAKSALELWSPLILSLLSQDKILLRTAHAGLLPTTD